MQKNGNEKRSLLLALLGYSIFGFSFIFSKRALGIATPFVLLAARFTAAFLILNLLLLTGRFKIRLKGKNLLPLLVLGIFQPVIYFICESYGVRLLATSFVGTVVALVPIASLALGAVLLKEKIRPFQAVCSLVSVVGVFLTTFGQRGGSFSWAGLLLLLGAVFAASMFNVLSRKASGEFSAFERTYMMFALGSAVFTVLALTQSWGNAAQEFLVPLSSFEFWVSVAFLSVASSVGSFLMLNYAVTYLNVAKTSIFANFTTVISIIAGVLILKEHFGLYQVLGSAIIIASVYFVNRPSSKKLATAPNQ